MSKTTRFDLFRAAIFLLGGLPVDTASADDFQVNTYTTGDQVFLSVAADADGDFVVVWHSDGSAGTDSLNHSVQGQRYASDGSPAGGEFQVNTYTTSFQTFPSVSMDAEGDFVVVWDSDGSGGTDSSGDSIQGQRYASDGSPVGGEFQVNTYTTNSQVFPSVSMAASGDFVVVWQSSSSATDYSWSIVGQRYGSDGSPAGGEFQINTYTPNYQGLPWVAADADGDFAVVWYSYGSSGTDSSGRSIQAQRYGSDGSPAGGEFQVNTYTTSDQVIPSVSLDSDGDFVVVWNSDGSSGTDSSGDSVQGRLYASDGSPVSGEFQVNTYTISAQTSRSVSLDADGDFVVVWLSDGSGGTDSSSYSIQGQRYASDGSPISGEFQVNTYTTNRQFRAAVTLDADGDFLVVWESLGSGGTDKDESSIQGRQFLAAIFADGFESGDTSAWSSSTG